MSGVVDGCPAFSEGCPFSKLLAAPGQDVATLFTDVISASLPKEIAEKCPAFKDGCPFSQEASVEELYNHMADMPATHRLGEPNLAASAVERTFHLVHQKSKEIKGRLSGAACPVFATSCPFKTLTSAGEPLVQEMDVFVDRWGLAEDIDAADVSPNTSMTKDAKQAVSPVAANSAVTGSTDTLSKCLKSGTKSVHRAAENVRFVREFLKGAVPLQSYVCFLRDLYHIYDALESALEEALPLDLRHCDFKVLRRAGSLAEDLKRLSHLPGYDGVAVDCDQASPAARQYVARIQYLRDHSPVLLIAHAYTRYLGDLSGGQILARAASKAYSLPEGEGTAFYRFDEIGSDAADIKAFKRTYRASLDALRLSAGEADAMVAEASNAFLLNILIFEERDVAAGHLDRVHSLEEISNMTHLSALKFQKAYAEQGVSKEEGRKTGGKCPFLPAAAQGGGSKPSTLTHEAVCPWPFVWLHDPRQATVAHPGKNVATIVGLYGFAHVAWRYPRGSTFCLLAFSAFSWWRMPSNVHHKSARSSEV